MSNSHVSSSSCLNTSFCNDSMSANNKTIWSVAEDKKLKELKDELKISTWKKISEYFKDKNQAQCAYRYKALCSKLKSKWTKKEENKLIQLIEIYGEEFDKIKTYLSKKTIDQIKDKYYKKIKPKNINFSEQEDLILTKIYREYIKRYNICTVSVNNNKDIVNTINNDNKSKGIIKNLNNFKYTHSCKSIINNFNTLSSFYLNFDFLNLLEKDNILSLKRKGIEAILKRLDILLKLNNEEFNIDKLNISIKSCANCTKKFTLVEYFEKIFSSVNIFVHNVIEDINHNNNNIEYKNDSNKEDLLNKSIKQEDYKININYIDTSNFKLKTENIVKSPAKIKNVSSKNLIPCKSNNFMSNTNLSIKDIENKFNSILYLNKKEDLVNNNNYFNFKEKSNYNNIDTNNNNNNNNSVLLNEKYNDLLSNNNSIYINESNFCNTSCVNSPRNSLLSDNNISNYNNFNNCSMYDNNDEIFSSNIVSIADNYESVINLNENRDKEVLSFSITNENNFIEENNIFNYTPINNNNDLNEINYVNELYDIKEPQSNNNFNTNKTINDDSDIFNNSNNTLNNDNLNAIKILKEAKDKTHVSNLKLSYIYNLILKIKDIIKSDNNSFLKYINIDSLENQYFKIKESMDNNNIYLDQFKSNQSDFCYLIKIKLVDNNYLSQLELLFNEIDNLSNDICKIKLMIN